MVMGLTERHWFENEDVPENYEWALEDAVMLKKQEAIKPYMDYDGQYVWRCGKCGNSLMHPSYYESDKDIKNYIKYCSHCGQAVKWND